MSSSSPAWRCTRCSLLLGYYEPIPPDSWCVHCWTPVPARVAHGKEVPPDRYAPLADHWDVLR